MATKAYKIRSQELIQAIEIAVDAFQKVPPEDFNSGDVASICTSYREMKGMIEDAEKHFQNLESLRYTEDAVFTYFQEAHGNCVNEFWKMIKAAELPFQRENKLGKLMKRGRIKDHIEYDFVIDVLVPYQEDGLVSEEDVKLLNQWIAEFEEKHA